MQQSPLPHKALDRYAPVFGLICVTVFVVAALPTGRETDVIPVALQIATMLLALRASGARRPHLLLAGGLSGIGVLSLVVALALRRLDASVPIYIVLMVGLNVLASTAIIRRLARQPRVNNGTVLGALSVYLLLGLLFATIYAGFQHATGQFFVQVSAPTPADFLYFSYTTLATVGYGDLTAAGRVARMVSIAEAVAGQLYLVTVVALVMANLGKRRDIDPDDTAAPQ